MDGLTREVEVEILHSMLKQNISPTKHFMKETLVFIDNIFGGFDSCKDSLLGREGGVGARYGTWCRARAVIMLLLRAMDLSPVLPFNAVNKSIKGLGISDDPRYARALAQKFDYTNTFYHKSPRLDVMQNAAEHEGRYDFILCSDILEHVIGDWRVAIVNLISYLKPEGVFIFSVPCSNQAENTVEHYPGAIDYKVVGTIDGPGALIKYSDGSEILAKQPTFHGGPGNTLEMRIFSKKDIQQFCLSYGWNCGLIEGDYPHFGIVFKHEEPGIFIISKKMGA